MKWTKTEIEQLDRVSKLNLINAISGIKPANLIGTKGKDGQPNLAIFSSVVHLGASPALLGMIVRPTGDVPRHTYQNILDTNLYTINHVNKNWVEKAHYTSAKFPKEVSEFEKCALTEEYLNDFYAPFVKESNVKIGMRYLESLPIERNGTILVVGEVEYVEVPDNALDEKGYLNLANLDGAGISGLNRYYSLEKIADFPYARVDDVPDFG